MDTLAPRDAQVVSTQIEQTSSWKYRNLVAHRPQHVPPDSHRRLRAGARSPGAVLPIDHGNARRLSSVARLTVALVALTLALTAPARATMVVPVSLARVTDLAARIVQATVLEVRSGRDDAGLPATWITLAVTRTLKGPHSDRITIKQIGVAAPLPDGTITRIAGMPQYRAGEEVVLFLHGDSRRGFTSPVGLGQGTYRVSRGAAGPQVRSDSGGARDLEDFLAEVKQRAASAP
jgi:hypothetical protein